jgi:hypothetical protein
MAVMSMSEPKVGMGEGSESLGDADEDAGLGEERIFMRGVKVFQWG